MLVLALTPATCTDACTHACSNICTSWDPPYVPQQPESWGGLGQRTKSQGCGTSPMDGGQAPETASRASQRSSRFPRCGGPQAAAGVGSHQQQVESWMGHGLIPLQQHPIPHPSARAAVLNPRRVPKHWY